MSNIANLPLDRGALTPQLSEQSFRTTLSKALAQIPHVRGLNNHMGSDLTQRHLQMSWLMQELGRRQLYFVDSRTTRLTVAATTASEFGIPNLSRQIFLDNERSTAAIAERFEQLLDLVDREGLAVAIGHPYPETIAYLRQALPQLSARGIRLALVSEVLATRQAISLAHAEAANQLADSNFKPLLR